MAPPPPVKVCLLCSQLTSTSATSASNGKNPSQIIQSRAGWSALSSETVELIGFPAIDLVEENDSIGMCRTCTLRTDYIASLVKKGFDLQQQINDRLDGVYSDLKKAPRTVVSRKVLPKLQPLDEYHEKAARNPKKYVFEISPVGSAAGTVSSGIRVPDVQKDISREAASEDGGECEVFEDADDGGSVFDSDFNEFSLVALDPDVVVSANEVELVCDHEAPADKSKCGVTFHDKEKFNAHKASHTLCVRVGHNVVRDYMPNLLQMHWKKFVTAGGGIKKTHCGHIECVSSAEIMNRGEFEQHLKEKHSLHVCPKFRRIKGQYLDACLNLYSSEQQLKEHLTCDHVKKVKCAKRFKLESNNPMESDDMDINEPDELRPIATVSENIVNCSACAPNHHYFLRDFGGHAARQHNCFVCLYKVESGNCLHSFKSKDLLLSHFEKEHSQPETGSSPIPKTLYLDPESADPQCCVCGQFGMNTSESYIRHMKEEHGALVCGKLRHSKKGFCRQVYHSELMIEVHRASCNLSNALKDKRYAARCSLCDRHLLFLDREAWMNHVREGHGALLCNIRHSETDSFCHKMELSRAVMKEHVEEQHATEIALGPAGDVDSAVQLYSEGYFDDIPGLPIAGPAVCQTCSTSFENFDRDWAEHVRSHGWIICDVVSRESLKPCLLICTSLEELRRHIHSVHRECDELLRCRECGIDLPTKSAYVKHILYQHMRKPSKICDLCGRSRYSCRAVCQCTKKFECDQCEKKFSSEWYLKFHKAKAHEGIEYPCTSCGMKFRSKALLKEHIYKLHKIPGANVFACPECGKTFCRKGDMKAHYKVSHGERKFKCDRCDWAFRTNHFLKCHIEQVHERIRAYVCYICGGSFKNNSYMQKHIRKHEAGLVLKPFKTRFRRLKTPPPLVIPAEASAKAAEASVGEFMDLT